MKSLRIKNNSKKQISREFCLSSFANFFRKYQINTKQFFSNDNASSRLCSNYFREATFLERLHLHWALLQSSHFSIVTSSIQQLLFGASFLWGKYFFGAATFRAFTLLRSFFFFFFQNSFFFNGKLLQCSYLVRKACR